MFVLLLVVINGCFLNGLWCVCVCAYCLPFMFDVLVGVLLVVLWCFVGVVYWLVGEFC